MLVAVILVAAACGGTPASSSPTATGKAFIPLISKGFQHQFWQAVKSGADQAAKDYKVTVTSGDQTGFGSVHVISELGQCNPFC